MKPAPAIMRGRGRPRKGHPHLSLYVRVNNRVGKVHEVIEEFTSHDKKTDRTHRFPLRNPLYRIRLTGQTTQWVTYAPQVYIRSESQDLLLFSDEFEFMVDPFTEKAWTPK